MRSEPRAAPPGLAARCALLPVLPPEQSRPERFYDLTSPRHRSSRSGAAHEPLPSRTRPRRRRGRPPFPAVASQGARRVPSRPTVTRCPPRADRAAAGARRAAAGPLRRGRRRRVAATCSSTSSTRAAGRGAAPCHRPGAWWSSRTPTGRRPGAGTRRPRSTTSAGDTRRGRRTPAGTGTRRRTASRRTFQACRSRTACAGPAPAEACACSPPGRATTRLGRRLVRPAGAARGGHRNLLLGCAGADDAARGPPTARGRPWCSWRSRSGRTPAGSPDTKNDLFVAPGAFLARATAPGTRRRPSACCRTRRTATCSRWVRSSGCGRGGAGLGGPAAVVEPARHRSGWSRPTALLAALRVGGPTARVLGALAYTLSPRVLSTIGGLSSEALPVLLAPAILLPVLLATRAGSARAAPRRCPASPCCAAGDERHCDRPRGRSAGLWLLTRRRWWRSPTTWWWTAASSPRVRGGSDRSSCWAGTPPFLDSIERSADVVPDRPARRRSWHDALARFVVTSGGELARRLCRSPPVRSRRHHLVGRGRGARGPGLAGAARATLLLLTLAVGVSCCRWRTSGRSPRHSPPPRRPSSTGRWAFRNIHKADPLVRAARGRAGARPRPGWPVRSRVAGSRCRLPAWAAGRARRARGGVAGAVRGHRTPRHLLEHGRRVRMGVRRGRGSRPEPRRERPHRPGRRLRRVIELGPHHRRADPPAVERLTTRCGMWCPLTPAGTIRILDAVEQTPPDRPRRRWCRRRAAPFRGALPGAARRPRHATAGQPVGGVRAVRVRFDARIELAKRLRADPVDASGERVFQVEVYDSGRPPRWPSPSRSPTSSPCPAARGPAVRGRRRHQRARGADGDRVAGSTPGRRVVTDGYRARDRWSRATPGEAPRRRCRRRAGRHPRRTGPGTTWRDTRSRPSPASPEWRRPPRWRPTSPSPGCGPPTGPLPSSTGTPPPRG